MSGTNSTVYWWENEFFGGLNPSLWWLDAWSYRIVWSTGRVNMSYLITIFHFLVYMCNIHMTTISFISILEILSFQKVGMAQNWLDPLDFDDLVQRTRQFTVPLMHFFDLYPFMGTGHINRHSNMKTILFIFWMWTQAPGFCHPKRGNFEWLHVQI